jgi:hypothetical protein
MFAFGAHAGGPAVDPLRARGIYLGILDAQGRQAFMDKALYQAKAALARVAAAEHDPTARDNWGHQAALLGVRFEIEARLRWLGELRRREALSNGGEHSQAVTPPRASAGP